MTDNRGICINFVVVLPPDSDLIITLQNKTHESKNNFGFDFSSNFNLTRIALNIIFHLLAALHEPKMT